MRPLRRHCTRTLLGHGAAPLVFLNWHFPRAALEHLWARAAYPRVCADGAANRLRRFNNKSRATSPPNPLSSSSSSSSSSRPSSSLRVELIPDVVYGDLDSLDPQFVPELLAKGAQVERNTSQETNDLQKCIEMICSSQSDKNSNHTADYVIDIAADDIDDRLSDIAPTHIIVAGALGGRLDHEMANLNVAMEWCDRRSLVLLGTHSMALVLPAGKNEIIPDPRLETPICGLIPLGKTCDSVTTTGLEYDLTERTLAFGGLISSSNAVRAGCTRVTVETSDPLLWTTSLSWERFLAQRRTQIHG